MRHLIPLLLTLICLAFPAAAAGTNISSFTLSNGIPVVLVENHRMPVVYHSLWLRIGGADDPAGKSGLAHFLEHMMFQGSDALAPGEYSRQIAAMGGQQNASTGRDYTSYYASIAREHLEEVMRLESERFSHMNPPEENFIKEREVILEERRAVLDNNPSARLTEQRDAALFLHHPYRIPIIGWKHEMEGLTRQDVLEFHADHYHAGNLTLVIAGDVTREALEPLAEKYYGRLPKRAPSRLQWVDEPTPKAARRVELRDPQVSQPTFSRSYLASSAAQGNTQQALPLLVLEYLLGTDGTGFLYRRLVTEQKIASSVATGYQLFSAGPGRFTLYATPAEGVTPEQLELAVDSALATFLATTPEPDEIARAKTMLKANSIYARDGLEGLGTFIGMLYALGLDEQYFLNWESGIDGVTAEQMMHAALATLIPERSVTAWLLPEKGNKK